MLRLVHAVTQTLPDGRHLLFGRIHLRDLDVIKVDTYQREQLPVRAFEEWREGFARGEVPALDLAFRGNSFRVHGSSCTVEGDEIYVVDGLQRLSTARLLYEQGHELVVNATIYTGSNPHWEQKRFRTLNSSRVEVAANVLLCNSQTYLKGMKALVDMSDAHNRRAMLAGRVQWKQRKQTGNLITAVSLVRVVGALHAFMGDGLLTTHTEELAHRIEDVTKVIGAKNLVANTDLFFQLINQACDLSQHNNSQSVFHLKLGYMLSLAYMLASHPYFWDGERLVLGERQMKALASMRFDELQRQSIVNQARPQEGAVSLMADKVGRALRIKLKPRA